MLKKAYCTMSLCSDVLDQTPSIPRHEQLFITFQQTYDQMDRIKHHTKSVLKPKKAQIDQSLAWFTNNPHLLESPQNDIE